MTLLDITNALITEFNKNEVLTKEELRDKIKLAPEFDIDAKELIATGLKVLEETGIVVKLQDKEVWILRQPLKAQGQTIELSMETCNEIGEIINNYLEASEVNDIRADKLNISENEIVMLINIINELLTE